MLATVNPQLLSRAQAARFLGISPATLAVWAKNHHGVPFVRVGRLVKYRRIDLEAYLDQRTIRVTTE